MKWWGFPKGARGRFLKREETGPNCCGASLAEACNAGDKVTSGKVGQARGSQVHQQGRGGKEAGVAITMGGDSTFVTSSGWTRYREGEQEEQRCGASPGMAAGCEFRW